MKSSSRFMIVFMFGLFCITSYAQKLEFFSNQGSKVEVTDLISYLQSQGISGELGIEALRSKLNESGNLVRGFISLSSQVYRNQRNDPGVKVLPFTVALTSDQKIRGEISVVELRQAFEEEEWASIQAELLNFNFDQTKAWGAHTDLRLVSLMPVLHGNHQYRKINVGVGVPIRVGFMSGSIQNAHVDGEHVAAKQGISGESVLGYNNMYLQVPLLLALQAKLSEDSQLRFAFEHTFFYAYDHEDYDDGVIVFKPMQTEDGYRYLINHPTDFTNELLHGFQLKLSYSIRVGRNRSTLIEIFGLGDIRKTNVIRMEEADVEAVNAEGSRKTPSFKSLEIDNPNLYQVGIRVRAGN